MSNNLSKTKNKIGIKHVYLNSKGSYTYDNRIVKPIYVKQNKSLSKLKEKIIGDNMYWIEFNKGGGE